jgi:hypothetical protein
VIWIIIAWCACGLVAIVLDALRIGKFLIRDLIAIPLGIFLGPVTLLIVSCLYVAKDANFDKVIWQRKERS